MGWINVLTLSLLSVSLLGVFVIEWLHAMARYHEDHDEIAQEDRLGPAECAEDFSH